MVNLVDIVMVMYGILIILVDCVEKNRGLLGGVKT
jgi:hypothetical protein